MGRSRAAGRRPRTPQRPPGCCSTRTWPGVDQDQRCAAGGRLRPRTIVTTKIVNERLTHAEYCQRVKQGGSAVISTGRTTGASRLVRARVHVRAVRALVVLAIASAGSALAPVADASSSLTWSGQSTITEDWTAPANWEGGSAPLGGEDIGTLSFP